MGLNPRSLSVGHTLAGPSSVAVIGGAGCTWTVRTDRVWLDTVEASVSGGGTLLVVVTDNGGAARSGSVMIGNKSVDIEQVTSCSSSPDSVTPSSVTTGLGAGTHSVTVTGRSDCSWTVSDDRSWITATPASVAGGGEVSIVVTATTGASRTGTVTIGDLNVIVTQCPTSPGVLPASLSLGSGANESGDVTLQEDAACSYAVTENLAWLRVNPSTVAGNGAVTVTTVTANDTGASRSGTVMIGARSISVTQLKEFVPPPIGRCTYSVLPYPIVVPDEGGQGTVRVSWQYVPDPNIPDVGGESVCRGWHISSSLSGMSVTRINRNTFEYTVSANDTPPTRLGSINIAGQTFTVIQGVVPTLTADAGMDRTVDVGALVELDCSASTGSWRGGGIQYEWMQQVSSDWYVLLREHGEDEVCSQYLGTCTLASPYFLAPATPGDGQLVFRLTVTDSWGGSHSDTVTVTVRGQVLADHRNRLIQDWATRNGQGTNVCDAYTAADLDARWTFIWNTHRLHRSSLLGEINHLYAMYGSGPQNSKNITGCGGPENNRTFMSMTPALMEKFYRVHQGDTVSLPQWRITGDPAGPHEPFLFSLEAYGDTPRGQIHFSHADFVKVQRTYHPKTRACVAASGNLFVRRTSVCDGTCDPPIPNPCDATHYSDSVLMDPLQTHTRGQPDNLITVDEYTF